MCRDSCVQISNSFGNHKITLFPMTSMFRETVIVVIVTATIIILSLCRFSNVIENMLFLRVLCIV